MNYQLVVQMRNSSKAAFETMLDLEQALVETLPEKLGYVDGHDTGSGETNIFIHTDDPRTVFAQVRILPKLNELLPLLRVAYREMQSDDWIILHPDGLTHFAVL